MVAYFWLCAVHDGAYTGQWWWCCTGVMWVLAVCSWTASVPWGAGPLHWAPPTHTGEGNEILRDWHHFAQGRKCGVDALLSVPSVECRGYFCQKHRSFRMPGGACKSFMNVSRPVHIMCCEKDEQSVFDSYCAEVIVSVGLLLCCTFAHACMFLCSNICETRAAVRAEMLIDDVLSGWCGRGWNGARQGIWHQATLSQKPHAQSKVPGRHRRGLYHVHCLDISFRFSQCYSIVIPLPVLSPRCIICLRC